MRCRQIKHIIRASELSLSGNKRSLICGRSPPRFSHPFLFGRLAAQVSHKFNQTCVAVLMYLTLSANIWILLSLIALATAHPFCSEIYGRPDSNDCMHVLNDYYATERALHCFAPAGFEQPGDVTNSQWERRVNIPKFSSHRRCFRTSFWPC